MPDFSIIIQASSITNVVLWVAKQFTIDSVVDSEWLNSVQLLTKRWSFLCVAVKRIQWDLLFINGNKHFLLTAHFLLGIWDESEIFVKPETPMIRWS